MSDTKRDLYFYLPDLPEDRSGPQKQDSVLSVFLR